MKLQGKILKTNADQRLVFGWASVAADESGKAVVDAAGDVIAIETLEKAAYEFTFHGGEGGLMHAITGVAALVESMVFTPEKIQLLNAEGLIPQGWWVGFYVYSDELWKQIKRGQFTAVELTANGLSIAGVSSIPLGILLEEPTDESVTVQIGGGGYWLAGESVAAGDFLSAGASGLAVKSTSGKFIFAQAMKCAAANEAAQVQIVRAGIKA